MVDLEKDILTGFPQRPSLTLVIERIILDSTIKKNCFSIAIITPYRFEKLNNKYSSLFTDKVIKYIAENLRSIFADFQSSIFRYSEEEFLVIFPDKSLNETELLIKRFKNNLSRQKFSFKNKVYTIPLCYGLAGFPRDAKTKEVLIEKAKSALSFSKRFRNNRIVLAEKIKNFGIYRKLLLSSGIILISLLYIYASYNNIFSGKKLKPAIKQIKNIRIMPKPKNLDKLYLKNGEIIEGTVIMESEKMLEFKLYLEQGEGTAVFDKIEIDRIEYNSQTSEKETNKESLEETIPAE